MRRHDGTWGLARSPAEGIIHIHGVDATALGARVEGRARACACLARPIHRACTQVADGRNRRQSELGALAHGVQSERHVERRR